MPKKETEDPLRAFPLSLDAIFKEQKLSSPPQPQEFF
jgi:hypothetical protein